MTNATTQLARAGSSDATRARRRRQVRRTIATWLKRSLIALVCAAVVVGIALSALPQPVPVDTGVADTGPLEQLVREDGKTRVRDRYVVSAPSPGNLLRVGVRAGDAVEAGSVLARVVPARTPLLDARSRAQAQARLAVALAASRQAAAELSRARVASEHADSELSRQTSLLARGAASQRALDQAEFRSRARTEELASAQFAVSVAEHQVAVARAGLAGRVKGASDAQIEVRAPVSGVVLRVFQESETVVAAGAPLLEVGDVRSLEVIADVLTRDAVAIGPGARVKIRHWGGGTALPGRVLRVEPSAFSRVSALGVEEQRVNVVIGFDADPALTSRLGDGYRVEVDIDIGTRDEVVYVPASAVFRDGDDWAVFRVVDGTAVLAPVAIGRRTEARVEIVSGLADGVVVIRHPSDRVTPGASVERRERRR